MKYILVFIFLSVCLNAQTRATTEEGKKVLLYEDGSWNYEETTDFGSSTITYDCSGIVSKEYSRNGINLIDPVKKRLEDLETMVMLYPDNQVYQQQYNLKLEFLRKLDLERAKGNIITEKRSPMIIFSTRPEIGLILIKSGNEFILTTWPTKKFCVNQNNMVYIKLKDGTILSLQNYKDNCEGVTYLSLNQMDIINLKKGIISISLETKDNGMTICNLNEDQNEQIRVYINCITN